MSLEEKPVKAQPHGTELEEANIHLLSQLLHTRIKEQSAVQSDDENWDVDKFKKWVQIACDLSSQSIAHERERTRIDDQVQTAANAPKEPPTADEMLDIRSSMRLL